GAFERLQDPVLLLEARQIAQETRAGILAHTQAPGHLHPLLHPVTVEGVGLVRPAAGGLGELAEPEVLGLRPLDPQIREDPLCATHQRGRWSRVTPATRPPV